MRRNTALAAALIASLLATPAHADNEENARNHGYQTAALEVACPGLVVTDKKLRDKRDRMYRHNRRWSAYFTEGYEFVVKNYSLRYDLGLYKDIDNTCRVAVGDWLAVGPDHRELGHLESKRPVAAVASAACRTTCSSYTNVTGTTTTTCRTSCPRQPTKTTTCTSYTFNTGTTKTECR